MKKLIVTSLGALALIASASLLNAASASDNWDNHCAKCHGADGTGNTKIGHKLHLKDYTDAKTLADKTDAQLEQDILDGVKRGGREVMKPFKGDLTPDEAKALVQHIRSFAKK
ncbi:cytochrome c [mine drainage metagenome]|uniref:Cytochrome c n=1 Tax=mine drainage metagenome TaxID=410659 RepID=A0A1J5SY11_9ZZZZ